MLPENSPFAERLIRFLVPFFLTITPDLDAARMEVLETLASYGARTRSEFLNAAQIIAFSFSALDLLAEAKATEMSVSMRLRFRGCANSLNRACQQNEKTLARRLACELPEAAQPASEPVNDTLEAGVQQALQQARSRIDTTRNRLSNTADKAHTMSVPQQERNEHLSRSAMMAVLSEMGLPPESTSLADGPNIHRGTA